MLWMIITVSACFALLLVSLPSLLVWRRIKNTPDMDLPRATLHVEVLKSVVQSIGALGLGIPVATAVLTYFQQSDQHSQIQRRELQKQNSDQFQVAISLLKENTLNSTEGAIVIVQRLIHLDEDTFRLPARAILRGTILDMQPKELKEPTPMLDEQAFDICVWSLQLSDTIDKTILEKTRYERLLAAYVSTYDTLIAENVKCSAFDNPDGHIDFSFLRTSKLDVPPIGTRHANFSNSHLPSVNFYQREFEKSCFEEAELRDGKFALGKFAGSSFQKANLQYASFVGADLRSSNFTGADLRNARLTGAKLAGANLRGANLKGAEVDLYGLSLACVAAETVLPEVISFNELVSRQERDGMKRVCGW